MNREKLSPQEISEHLKETPEWTEAGGKLTRRFEFPNFAESLDFVNKAGAAAEEMDHHPDIRFGWGYAEFEITTHDRGGLTEFDFALARAIDAIR